MEGGCIRAPRLTRCWLKGCEYILSPEPRGRLQPFLFNVVSTRCMHRSSLAPWLSPLLLLLGLAGVSGCGGPGRGGPPDAQMAALRPRLALRGNTTFFDNRVAVEITVSNGRAFAPGGKPAGEAGESRPSGGGMGGPPPGGGGGMGGPPPGGMGGGMGGGGGEDVGGRMVTPASRPPATLRVSLRNLSAEPLDVKIRDVNSALGNFAVRPEHVLLAPDQSTELDPMVSRLVDVGDDLPVTVTLRIGTQTETQEVRLHTVETARQDK